MQKEFKNYSDLKDVHIYTSTLKRAMTTANAIKLIKPPVYLKILDEIDTGICDGLTYDEIKIKYP